MSKATLRAVAAPAAATDDLLREIRDELRGIREIRAELRGIRADLRRRRDGCAALVAALADEFGDGRFTCAGVLAVAADDPDSALARALADVIDMDAAPRSRATALGVLLARMEAVEVVAESHRAAVYRLRTLAPEVR